jgi:acetyl esterase/lipase
MAPPAPPNGVVIEELHVSSSDGTHSVRVVVYASPDKGVSRPALLHTHGGGYLLGRPELSDARLRSLVTELECVVVSVDYRLPPEHPHPAPIDDCYTALKWLHDNAGALGVDANRIAIGGESAGGGLAAALTLLARDRGEVPVAFQLLIYPMLDDRTCVETIPNTYTGEFIWTREANRLGWRCLLGEEPAGLKVSPYAAAARAESLVELPPTFIAVGALDLFLEEDIAYAKQLLKAGIATELHVYPGAFHAFDMMATAAVAQRFECDFRSALRRAWLDTAC